MDHGILDLGLTLTGFESRNELVVSCFGISRRGIEMALYDDSGAFCSAVVRTRTPGHVNRREFR